MENVNHAHGIPIATSLADSINVHEEVAQEFYNKRRLITISLLGILVAVVISFIAKMLVYLINIISNLSFFHSFSLANSSPANNHLGLTVIIVPAVGGILVGLMAY